MIELKKKYEFFYKKNHYLTKFFEQVELSEKIKIILFFKLERYISIISTVTSRI